MNFFFGINNSFLNSEIQIPLFQNRVFRPSKLKLFKCAPFENKWKFDEIDHSLENEFFFIIKNQEICNKSIYFFSDQREISNLNTNLLKNYTNFTDTNPAFRANLKVYLDDGGFSSYQSEYPYSMVNKRGSILSTISSLANIDADENYIIIKNIYEKPIEELFYAYLVDYKLKKVEKKFELLTNNVNYLKIEKELIRPEMLLFTRDYVGVPIYLSIKNKSLSLEHTHPPHEYILSSEKFNQVANLKKEINEIIA